MTHWQMDDAFLGHHKTKRALRAGAEALQMWCALRTYVAVNLSDGVIPDEDIDDLPHAPRNPRKWLAVLVSCGKPLDGGGRGPGLVDPTHGGWELHDYAEHGESKEVIEKRRAASRERQRRFREAKERVTNDASAQREQRVRNGVTHGVTNASPSHPIPSHPIPKTPTGSESMGAAAPPTPSKRAPKSVLWPVDSWAGPTDAHRELAAEKGLDANYQADRMRDWAKSKGERKADWDAAFRNWLHRQHAPRDERSGTQIRLLPRGEDRHLQRVLRIEAEEKAAKEAFR